MRRTGGRIPGMPHRYRFAALAFGALMLVAAVARASGGGTADINWWKVGWLAVDSLLLFGLLGYLLRKPLKQTFIDRHHTIATEVAEAQAGKAAAETRRDVAEKNMTGLEAEIGRFRDDATSIAAREAEHERQRAQHEAARIAREAEDRLKHEHDQIAARLNRELIMQAFVLLEGGLSKNIMESDHRAQMAALMREGQSRGAVRSVQATRRPPASTP